MKKIFAILDVQGFIKNKEFRPREISILDDVQHVHYEVNSDLGKLSNDDMKTNIWNSMYITGLPLYTNNGITIEQMKGLITSFAMMNSTKKRPYYGIKNQQLAKFLDQLGVKYVALHVPSMRMMERMYGDDLKCGLHFRIGSFNCAARKTRLIQKYLKNFNIMRSQCLNTM
jgi:hypothetical protein